MLCNKNILPRFASSYVCICHFELLKISQNFSQLWSAITCQLKKVWNSKTTFLTKFFIEVVDLKGKFIQICRAKPDQIISFVLKMPLKDLLVNKKSWHHKLKKEFSKAHQLAKEKYQNFTILKATRLSLYIVIYDSSEKKVMWQKN